MLYISINNKFVLYYFRWKVYSNYGDNFVWPKFFITIFDASVFVGFLRDWPIRSHVLLGGGAAEARYANQMHVQLLAHDWQRNMKNQQKKLSTRYINEKKIALNGQQDSPY